ncbi:hypothetical protein TRFO_14114 [Tritrichomonas foetus]|uniref:F5/8 type C domain-containing protein n=1 Tax=Tritrichomonas foetus TaxID=1144522 RepID=A0A1J4L077_9EUKA|nr:hypothetical protein TRFO_14114 [Tritrichomonas foetus]|eukprot:OHT15366.1 hypothetical protein TRFO_14114 [Tritrichomonas foetus]
MNVKIEKVPKIFITPNPSMEITLNIRGLQRLNFENNFVFHMGELNLQCSRAQAAFLSKTCYQQFMSDPTIDSFTFQTNNSEIFLPYLEKLINGFSIDLVSIPSDQLNTFRDVLHELNSLYLLSLLKSFNETITIDNCISMLEKKAFFMIDYTEDISFISSHFYEIEKERLLSLDIEHLIQIVESPNLRLEDESSFCSFIIEYNDPLLLSYLEYKALNIQDLTTLFQHFSFSSFEQSWPSIVSIITEKDISSSFDRSRYQSIKIFYNDSLFSGVFSYLFNKTGGNPATNNTVEITTTDWPNNSSPSYNIIDPTKRNEINWWFGSSNTATIIFNLKNYRVKLNGYTLKSHSSSWSNGCFLNSWQIEGSNDGNNWVEVDSKSSNLLHENLKSVYFQCDSESNYYQYFRFRQTSKNTSNTNHIALHSIEFFGFLIKKIKSK